MSDIDENDEYVHSFDWAYDSETVQVSLDDLKGCKKPPEKPKCDCGGVKCKLPCVDWCSLKKRAAMNASEDDEGRTGCGV